MGWTDWERVVLAASALLDGRSAGGGVQMQAKLEALTRATEDLTRRLEAMKKA